MILVLATFASILTAYFLFLTPSQYSTSTIDISSRFIKSWPGAIFVITFFSTRFVALPLIHKIIEKPMCWYYYGLSLGGLPAFFIYRNSTWNLTAYFIFPGLVLMPVLIAILFRTQILKPDFSRSQYRLIACLFFVQGILLQILLTIINWKQAIRFNALQVSEYFVVLPLISIFTYFVLLKIAVTLKKVVWHLRKHLNRS